MPREIVHMQVGQCGNQVGTKFWETLAQEHGLAEDGTYQGNDPGQLEKINVFFNEGNGKYVPRCVLVDMEETVLNYVQMKPYGTLFPTDNIIAGTEGAANQFMVGYYSDLAVSCAEKALNIARKETEKSDCLQGITFTHSTGGGTGSGLGMRLFSMCNDLLTPSFGCAYSFAVFPSKRISDVVVESYNTCLTLDQMSNVENVVVLDNEALHRICTETLRLNNPTYADLNQLISLTMAGVTASIRFPGQHNMDLNKLSYSLRCRPFLHYYIPSYAPLTAMANIPLRKLTVAELLRQALDKNNLMCECIPELPENSQLEIDAITGKTFAQAALFRGDMCTYTVDESMTFIKPNQPIEDSIRLTLQYNERKNPYLEGLQNCVKYVSENPRREFSSICNYAAPGTPMSLTYLRNSSNVKFKFLSIINQAADMYNTRAFCQWYEQKGSDVRTLEECLKKLCTEWIAEFGIEDKTNYPEQVNLN